MGEPRSLRRGLRRLAWARMAAVALVLATGAALHFSGAADFRLSAFALGAGVAGLVAAALLAIPRPRGPDLRGVAWLHLGVDVGLASLIVATSGGAASFFAPLYILVVIAACVLLARPGGLVTAGMSAVAYVGIVLVQALAPHLMRADPGGGVPLGLLAAFVNTAVFLVVALVAGSLAQQYHRVREDLETERRGLSDLQAFRDLVFDSVGSGLIALSPDWRITAFNRAAESITGIRAQEAVGQPWETILGPGIDLAAARAGAAATAGEDAPPRRHEIRLWRADGRELPLGVSFWLLRTGRGEEAGLIGVCQDLSWIKQMEERVRLADRLAAVGRLSANIAHEIRNPLAALAGSIEALVKDLPPDTAHGPLAEIALRESDRLNRIITDFLDYARPRPPVPIPCTLGPVLDEVLLLLEHGAHPESLKIARQYGEDVAALVDPQQIRQVLWNICVNAIQAMPGGGELCVGARRLPGTDRVEVSIADTGPGIPEADLPNIFEPFYTTRAGGTGIGLAIVYRIIQDHGGQVEVESGPGTGTTFTLTLPAAPSPA